MTDIIDRINEALNEGKDWSSSETQGKVTYEINKRDYDVFIDLSPVEVQVDITRNDSVNTEELSGIKYTQSQNSYTIKPKNEKELKKVLKILKVKPLKLESDDTFKF